MDAMDRTAAPAATRNSSRDKAAVPKGGRARGARGRIESGDPASLWLGLALVAVTLILYIPSYS